MKVRQDCSIVQLFASVRRPQPSMYTTGTIPVYSSKSLLLNSFLFCWLPAHRLRPYLVANGVSGRAKIVNTYASKHSTAPGVGSSFATLGSFPIGWQHALIAGFIAVLFCRALCHPGEDCPAVPCDELVTISCECKRYACLFMFSPASASSLRACSTVPATPSANDKSTLCALASAHAVFLRPFRISKKVPCGAGSKTLVFTAVTMVALRA